MTDKLEVAPTVCPMDGSCAEYLRIVDMIRIRQEQVAALNRLLDAHVTGADDVDDIPWVTHLPHS